tara:strand:+ start:3 stop:1487 length:1485 start_codon:yes stop_codon:yes gene_type:complete
MSYKQSERIADLLAKKSIENSEYRCVGSDGNDLPYNDSSACEGGGGSWIKGYTELKSHQKTIKGGSISTGRESDTDRIVMYKSDLLAHSEELYNISSSAITENTLTSNTMTQLESGNLISDPHNVSQFLDFDPSQLQVNPELADQVLDNEITELLPEQTNRQQQIDQFFRNFTELAGDVPEFLPPDEDGNVVMNEFGSWFDIASNPSNPNASIIRLSQNENSQQATPGQSLESLRDTLNDYLQDIDTEPSTGIQDNRPEYVNKSSGYLKIRGLNQSILIKREDGQELTLSELVDDGTGVLKPKFLVDGFTITQWVRFKDKINGGTLFNLANPTRETDPYGFKLETFILKSDEVTVPAGFEFEDGTVPFSEGDYERFVRLVIREDATLRDSHVGLPNSSRQHGIATGDFLLNCTRIPIDLEEWYFIVANYNPDIVEDSAFGITGTLGNMNDNPDFWRWNITQDGGSYTTYSQYGAKCKVEIISKSDLLRARGFKI